MQSSDKTFTREAVLEIFKTFQYLYRLKYEIRYELERDAQDFTESVAEHIYGMHLLADFFLLYEDPEHKLDRGRLRQMITWHDIDEIETGDIIGWKKSEIDRENETIASERVLQKLPEPLKTEATKVLEEYEKQITTEAKFVKAIDKIEPMFHLYNQKGKEWSLAVQLTRDASMRIKVPYVDYFPTIKLFNDHIHDQMESEGFFTT